MIDLTGYYQSIKYFEEYQDVILGLLTPKIGYEKKWNTTSMHIRRGDYLNLTKEYEQLQIDYYHRAMDITKSKHYLIVSDDIPWCERNFIGNQFQFSKADEVTDIALQIACENNIIANSSFSWWGAFLNKNPSKIIVAPQKWFGPALNHNTVDLLPSKWIKI